MCVGGCLDSTRGSSKIVRMSLGVGGLYVCVCIVRLYVCVWEDCMCLCVSSKIVCVVLVRL